MNKLYEFVVELESDSVNHRVWKYLIVNAITT